MNQLFASPRFSQRARRGCAWTALGVSIVACNERLTVLDPPIETGNAGAGGSAGSTLETVGASGANGSAPLPELVSLDAGVGGDGGSQALLPDAEPSPAKPLPISLDTTCGCGSSEHLQALGCGSPSYSAGAPMISEDGETVAFSLCFNGSVGEAICAPFRWTRTGGTKQLPSADGSIVAGLSADGDQVLVKPPPSFGASAAVYRASDDTSVETGLRPQPLVMGSDGSVLGVTIVEAGSSRLSRWTRGGPLQVLGDVPFEANQVRLWSTPSLTVVAGMPFESDNTSTPFRWTQTGGIELGLPGLATVASPQLSLSRDGSTLAGHALGEENVLEAFSWKQDAGVVRLGVSVSANFARVFASADGSVIAATSDPNPTETCGPICDRVRAVRWTQADGALELTPGVSSYPTLISNDGSLILGVATAGTFTPFYWTAEHGARGLLAELATAGADMNGWELDAPVSLSSDGRIVTGYGVCNGRSTAYRAVLPE